MPLLENAKEDCLKVVIGTKQDLVDNDRREISIEEAIAFSKEINEGIDLSALKGDPYFETSAKTGYNVSKVFEYMFSYCLPLDNISKLPVKDKSTIQLTDTSNSGNKQSCCKH